MNESGMPKLLILAGLVGVGLLVIGFALSVADSDDEALAAEIALAEAEAARVPPPEPLVAETPVVAPIPEPIGPAEPPAMDEVPAEVAAPTPASADDRLFAYQLEEQELVDRIAAQRAAGETDRSLTSMEVFVERFPAAVRTRVYEQLLERSGRELPGTGSGVSVGLNAPGRSAVGPAIRMGNADVRGSLSREVIRRVIRRHLNEVRFCYEQGLGDDPSLTGRVSVAFVVSPTGAVQSARIADSTMHEPRVEGCLMQAVRRWTFPSPDGGGIVLVTYPFVFSPG